jgi:ribosomal protein S18 acetylase RimI-like enzyme
MSVITLRPATLDDLPAITQIGIDTNSSFPIYSIGLAPPADPFAVSLARTKHFFAQPHYHFTVAVEADSPAEVVACMCFKDGGEFEEVPFQPDLPEGANVAFMGYFLGTRDEHKNTLPIKGLPELETLDVRTGYQRKGIGKMLVEEVVKIVDGRGEGCYVHSSKMGKGLYEKFGWRALDEKGFGIELVQFGEREPLVTWDMVREVGGAVGGGKEE